MTTPFESGRVCLHSASSQTLGATLLTHIKRRMIIKKILHIGMTLVTVSMLSGCMMGYVYDPTNSYRIEITGTSYDNTYSKALFVLSEQGYTVSGVKDSGIISGFKTKGGGVGTTSLIQGLLTNLKPEEQRLNLKVKSSRGDRTVAEEFVAELEKYADAKFLD